MCLSVLTLAGCGGSTSDPPAAQTQPPAEADLPATLFVVGAPDGAVTLIEAKSEARPGDRVVFEARIGGRRAPFVEHRAVFSVVDPSLLSCDQLHDGTCKAPWDYCCEPRENLLEHMATVQVIDAGGQPLKRSLESEHGLEPLRTVFVSGTVESIDESGNFVVNAEAIHVKGG
jgi:hypothetical protein